MVVVVVLNVGRVGGLWWLTCWSCRVSRQMCVIQYIYTLYESARMLFGCCFVLVSVVVVGEMEGDVQFL